MAGKGGETCQWGAVGRRLKLLILLEKNSRERAGSPNQNENYSQKDPYGGVLWQFL